MHAPRFLLTVLLCGGGLLSQAPTAQLSQTVIPSDFRTPIHTMDPDPMGAEYGVWAAGSDYKVSFHGDMTVIPYLGAQHPRTMSWSWRTIGVRIGQQDIVNEGARVERVHTDWRYEYRYGPVTERYAVLAEGVEQSFVVHHRPAVPGDLVVQGRITSTLSAAEADDAHQSLGFSDARGRELIRYGAAWVFDATGRKADIATRCEEGIVTLTVPAAWLAEATFPVTIDPLTAPVGLDRDPNGNPPESLDITTVDDRLFFAFARSVSATDKDVYAFRSSLNFSGIIPVYQDLDQWMAEDPCVTGLDAGFSMTINHDKFIVAYTRGDPSTNRSWCVYHIRDSRLSTLGSSFRFISPPRGARDSRPDIGGMRPRCSCTTVANPTALLVWQRSPTAGGNSSILACEIDASGTAGPEIVLAASGTFIDHQRPSISQMSFDPPSLWAVVWQSFVPINGAGEWALNGVRVGTSGTVSGGWSSARNSNGTIHKVGAQVDGGDGGSFLVAYTTISTSSATRPQDTLGEQLVVELADFNGGSGRAVTLRSSTTRSWELGGVAFDRGVTESQWAVTYHKPGEASISRIGNRGSELETAVLASGATMPISGGVTIPWDQTTTADYPTVFGHQNSAGGIVVGRRLLLPVPRTPIPLGTSCGSGTTTVDGPRLISSTSTLQLSGVEPTAQGHAALLAIAFRSNNLPVPSTLPFWPGCMLNVDLGSSLIATYFRVTSNNGSASIDIDVPDFLPTLSVTAQWFYDDPGSQQVPRFRATRGLRVEFAR